MNLSKLSHKYADNPSWQADWSNINRFVEKTFIPCICNHAAFLFLTAGISSASMSLIMRDSIFPFVKPINIFPLDCEFVS